MILISGGGIMRREKNNRVSYDEMRRNQELNNFGRMDKIYNWAILGLDYAGG